MAARGLTEGRARNLRLSHFAMLLSTSSAPFDRHFRRA
jgi:hypothetical protein